jgi:hypothetical protein
MDMFKLVTKKLFPKNELMFIHNAGMILFWPYLTCFFNSLDLIKNDNFVNEARRKRACLLLHYMVTGMHEASENELTLNKILCGMDLHIPVQMHYSFNENESNSCVILLKSVIQDWPVLKNVSLHKLCKMFFLRDGFIRTRDGCLILHVEEKPYDFFLDNVPWEFYTIKLPWMENLLFVEWGI